MRRAQPSPRHPVESGRNARHCGVAPGARAVRRRPDAAGLALLVFLATSGLARASDPPATDPAPEGTVESSVGQDAGEQTPFALLGESVAPGHRLSLTLRMGESFAGAPISVPVTITHGRKPGPVVCLVAGIHGDELNGVEIVRRTVAATSARTLKGTLVGIPIANLHGLQRGSRYLPDRRDLNRHFPGSQTGSAASRIADVLFRRIVRSCDLLIDFHTGSLRRTNLSQLRADLANASVFDLAIRFGGMPVLNNPGRPGTLRRATTDIGIAAVTYEAGEPMRFDEAEIERGVQTVAHLLSQIDRATPADEARGLFWSTRWVRVDQGGIFMSRVALGDTVGSGHVLGVVTNPISGEESAVVAPGPGTVLGMALNQVVIPGFAAYHLGNAAAPARPEGAARAAAESSGAPPEDDDAS